MCLIAAMFLSRLLRRFSPWFLSFSFRFVSFSLVPQVQELEERYFDIANLRFNAINENPHAFRFDIGTLESTQQIRTTRSANNTHQISFKYLPMHKYNLLLELSFESRSI